MQQRGKHWNPAYEDEALQIAADVMQERGYAWTADQIRRYRKGQSERIEIAMRALMVARGDLQLKRPL